MSEAQDASAGWRHADGSNAADRGCLNIRTRGQKKAEHTIILHRCLSVFFIIVQTDVVLGSSRLRLCFQYRIGEKTPFAHHQQNHLYTIEISFNVLHKTPGSK